VCQNAIGKVVAASSTFTHMFNGWLQIKADIAASFQHIATQHLVERVSRAAAWAKELDPSVRYASDPIVQLSPFSFRCRLFPQLLAFQQYMGKETEISVL
jgi:hypothetical protein